MRTWQLVLIQLCTACDVGTMPAVGRVPCGPPIVVTAKPDDVIVLDDAAGEPVDMMTTPATGHVVFDAPDCSNSVTMIGTYYSFEALYALTVMDVAPGARIDLTSDRWGIEPTQPDRVAISIDYSVADNEYASFVAPACSIVGGSGSCSEPPTHVYGVAAVSGTSEPFRYALVPTVIDTTHDGKVTASVDAWRTDFASMPVDILAAPANSATDVSIYMHAEGETYAIARSNAIPLAGDAYTVIASAYRDQTDSARYRRDMIIDPFAGPPSQYTADFSTIATVDSASVSEIKTFAWDARDQPADVTRICGSWSRGLAGWCVLVPATRRTLELPCLPSAFDPTEPPTIFSVSTIDTSLAAGYDDVVRTPFRSFAAPWSGGPDLRIRVSNLGFVPPPWWWL